MAHISELTLSHFRSHRRTEIAAGAQPVAIYGPNGAGKTNILEALSLMSPGRGLRRAGAEELIRKPEAVGWKVAAALTAPDRLHELETWAEPGTSRQVRIDGKPAPQVALGRLARMLWLVPSMDRLWIEGAEGRRRFLDRMTMSFEPSHADTVLTYEKAMRERNRLLRDQVNEPHWYAALERQMAESGARIDRTRQQALQRLDAAQSGAATVFPAARLSLTGFDATDADAFHAALADGRRDDMRAGRTLTGPHRADLDAIYAAKDVPAAQASTGEQKALLISLVLSNARALAEDLGHPPIILLDEVAAHLDADRRASLYAEIEALGAQAWMTGTGPELFEALGDTALRLSVSEADGVSRVA